MMRWLAACLLLAPCAGMAAEYPVRSGEHDGFSRLVIYMDEAHPWEVTATETGYELEIVDSSDGFDTGEVFEFIPKRRLTGVQAGPGRLRLEMGCDCPLQAFAYRPDILVLDLYSDTPDPSSVPNGRLVMPRDAASPSDGATQKTEQKVTPVPTTSALPAWTLRAPIANRAGKVLGFVVEQPAETADVGYGSRLDHSELVAGIAEAASHGLVTLSAPEARGDATLSGALAGLRNAGEQLEIRDTLLRPYDPTLIDEPTQHCLPADLFAVHEWGDPNVAPGTLLSDLRSGGAAAMVGDRAADGAIGMIRSYLYLGFGSEATEVIRTYRIPAEEEKVYSALAGIVDFPGRAAENALADQSMCSTAGALWAFVATRDAGTKGGDVNSDAILRYFARLPHWLRAHIGDVAAANFDAREDPVSAQAIRDAMARAWAARVAQHPETASSGNENQDHKGNAQSDPQGPPEPPSDRSARVAAAHQILREHVSNNRGTRPEDRAEITALILETRGSEDSQALVKAYLGFVSEPEDILAAEHILNVLSRSRFASSYPLHDGWDTLLAAATSQASHDSFLGVLSRNRTVYQKAPPSRRTADGVVDRLTAMGLTQSAAEYAEILRTSPKTQGDLELRSQAARPQGQTNTLSAGNGAEDGNGAGIAADADQVVSVSATGNDEFGGSAEPSEATDTLIEMRSLLQRRQSSQAISGQETPIRPLDVLLETQRVTELLNQLSLPTPAGG